MGRTATGVKGIGARQEDQVIDLVVVRRKSTLHGHRKGMGKRSELGRVSGTAPGRSGIITLKRADKTGNMRRPQGSAPRRRADVESPERIMIACRSRVFAFRAVKRSVKDHR